MNRGTTIRPLRRTTHRVNLDSKVACRGVVALLMCGLLLVGCSKPGGTGSTAPVAAAKSVSAMGEIYKTIFETTRALKPNSVTQSCPCGTPPGLAWFRYMDQAVTADPVGSVQVRRRIKMYKALLGQRAAVYGDHVELTRITGASTGNEQDLGSDFASTLGTGGVLGTKFTWPDYGPKFKNVCLDAEKEAEIKGRFQ